MKIEHHTLKILGSKFFFEIRNKSLTDTGEDSKLAHANLHQSMHSTKIQFLVLLTTKNNSKYLNIMVSNNNKYRIKLYK